MRVNSLWGMRLVAALAAAWGVFLAAPVWANEPAGHPHESATAPQKAAGEHAACPACKMCAEHMKTLAKVKELLAEAKGAAEAEGAKMAAAKIAEVQSLLARQEKAMHEMMARRMQMMHKDTTGKPASPGQKPAMTCPMGGMMKKPDGIVNTRCPIQGAKLDPANVPENLTRMFNGQKVGFCCAGCPQAWDRLTDQQKQQKLEAAMGETPKAPQHEGHGH